MIVVTVAALGARVVSALHDPLWLDEVVSARIITQPSLSATVSRVRQTESSPPGWHLANWVLRRAAGSPGRVERLRLLSVAFGGVLAALVVVYALSLGLTLPGAAVAGALIALGPNLVAHGAELRPYSLLTLIALLFALALRSAVARPSAQRLAVLALVVLAGCYTHYFFLFLLGTGFCWTALRASGRPRLRVCAAQVAGFVPFLVWAPDFVHQYRHNLYAYNGAFNLKAVAYAYARIVGLVGETGAVPAAVRLLFAVAVLAGAALLVRRPGGEEVAAFAVVPVALAAVFWLVGPHVFNERNLLVSAPFAAVAVGALVSALSPKLSAVGVAALAVVLGISVWHYEVDYGRSPYDKIAHALVADGWQPRDEIIQFGPAPLGLLQPVGWYLPGHPLLARAHLPRCGSLFAISYDGGRGATWIAAHAVASPRRFPAYDHTPRGPAARTPVVAARVSSGPETARSATRLGGRLLRDPSARVRCG